MTMTKEVLNQDVLDKAESGLTVENIANYLYAIGETKNVAEARRSVEAILGDAGKKPAKKVTMADQLKEWFHDQPDPMVVTKEELKAQIEAIGMSGGSVNWYIRVYQEAQAITKRVLEDQAKQSK